MCGVWGVIHMYNTFITHVPAAHVLHLFFYLHIMHDINQHHYIQLHKHYPGSLSTQDNILPTILNGCFLEFLKTAGVGWSSQLKWTSIYHMSGLMEQLHLLLTTDHLTSPMLLLQVSCYGCFAIVTIVLLLIWFLW